MKKLLFSLFLILAMNVNSQTFDEVLLEGTWKPTHITGTLPYGIESFTGITLGECVPYWDNASGIITELRYKGGEYHHFEEGEEVTDFYISNNNKLHIIVSGEYALRFIIEELTETSLKVKTYDGTGSITLTKENSTRVGSITKTPAQSTDAYSLSGQKVTNLQPNTIYIKDGQKQLIRK